MGPSRQSTRLTRFLETAPGSVFVPYAILTAFSTYFCMYAFRKPFAAATFEGETFFGTAVELKTAIVISQIIGYALSKYLGIKFCSEITPARRVFALIFLVAWGEAALILYGWLPNNFKVLAIFLNGVPLGMVWGVVVRYLEGRRTSELLLAGLSCSYILASGIVKDFGRALMDGIIAEWWQRVPLVGPWIGRAMGEVSEGWMPAVTGLHFLPLFLVSVWLLDQLPKPSEADVSERVQREPMDRSDRLAFIRQFLLGLSLLCVAYFFLTAYRDFRDNYQVELFDGLGYPYEQNKAIITQTETLVMFGVLGALALLNMIRDNRLGLIGAFALMIAGSALMGISTLLLDAGIMDGFWWMTCIGLGSYLAYVPYGSVLFDRMMASTRVVGTAVFAIYLADAIGYTGSVGVQLYKDLAQGDLSRLGFFKGFTYLMSILGFVCLGIACAYFVRRSRSEPDASQPPAPTGAAAQAGPDSI